MIEYYKVSVHPKDGTKYNYLHDKINGHKCKELEFTKNNSGIFKVEMEEDYYHTIFTSPVLYINETDKGTEIETINTFYCFERI